MKNQLQTEMAAAVQEELLRKFGLWRVHTEAVSQLIRWGISKERIAYEVFITDERGNEVSDGNVQPEGVCITFSVEVEPGKDIDFFIYRDEPDVFYLDGGPVSTALEVYQYIFGSASVPAAQVAGPPVPAVPVRLSE